MFKLQKTWQDPNLLHIFGFYQSPQYLSFPKYPKLVNGKSDISKFYFCKNNKRKSKLWELEFFVVKEFYEWNQQHEIHRTEVKWERFLIKNCLLEENSEIPFCKMKYFWNILIKTVKLHFWITNTIHEQWTENKTKHRGNNEIIIFLFSLSKKKTLHNNLNPIPLDLEFYSFYIIMEVDT